MELSLVPSLLRVDDDYKRALYSLTSDVIVLKLTTDPLQAPGDISTRLDEVTLHSLSNWCPPSPF